MNTVQQLAHSLLNKGTAQATHPQHTHQAQPGAALKLPKHVLDHAHTYITHIMKAKGFL